MDGFARRALGLCLLAVVAACGLSCGSGGDLNPVAGKVLRGGKPLAGALVAFHAEAGDLASMPATGLTKEDGTFTLDTGGKAGAPAGTYVVTIIHPVPVKAARDGSMSMGESTETQDGLQGRYADRQASQIKVTVHEGSNQLEPFDLK